jgi:hypothetical protein
LSLLSAYAIELLGNGSSFMGTPFPVRIDGIENLVSTSANDKTDFFSQKFRKKIRKKIAKMSTHEKKRENKKTLHWGGGGGTLASARIFIFFAKNLTSLSVMRTKLFFSVLHFGGQCFPGPRLLRFFPNHIIV